MIIMDRLKVQLDTTSSGSLDGSAMMSSGASNDVLERNMHADAWTR